MDDDSWWLWILILAVALGFSLWKFSEIQKHFPEMTYKEYLLIGDNVVITPDK